MNWKKAMIDEFTKKLEQQTERKAKLYDGVGKDHSIDYCIRFAIEELGEIASAITRERYELAEAECIDLAHITFLIWKALKS